jgi:O-antigen/teichoic acid export membrane protein
LLAAIAGLGLPNVVIRRLAGAENARELMIVAITAIATVGTVLCLASVLVLGPHLPSSLGLKHRGGTVLLVTALVTFSAVSTILDVGLVATRSSHGVLIKNLAGSITRVAAMLLLVSFPSSGLLIAYGLGLGLTVVLGSALLDRQIRRKRVRLGLFRVLRSHLSITSGNYLATIMGILPVSIVPLQVLVVLGAVKTGQFAVAFLIGGFLNVVPSTVARVLFAEASREEAPLRGQARKAIRGVYGLLLPAIVIVIVAAPFILSLFGAAYATAATGCLRVLALSALFTGGTYLVDSLLIARDRIAAYVFMNGANAALVLGFVGILVRRGLTAAAVGWALAQGLSLLLGLVVLATARLGRHRQAAATPAGKASQNPRRELPRAVISASEPQVRDELLAMSMMPATTDPEPLIREGDKAGPGRAVTDDAPRPVMPGTLPERRRLTGAAALGLAPLVRLGSAVYHLVAGWRPAAGAVPSARAHPVTHSHAGHGRQPAATPERATPAHTFAPAGATAFNPYSADHGDNSDLARCAIDGNPATAWRTDSYTTAHLGNLYPGTGLLVDMGRPVTITAVQLTLGSTRGTDFQLRVGAAPALADLPPVAVAAHTGGVVHLPLTVPAHGRYLLIWFTSLPPDRAGTFQASVHNLRVEGCA